MATNAELFALAVQHHQSGNLAQAEPLYRQVLNADPRHADAYHLLGILATQTGHHEAAAALIRQAIALNPAAPVFHAHLGTVYKELGKLTEAIACYRHVTRMTPDSAEAHNNLAFALLGKGELGEATDCFRHVLRINPNLAEAHNNLGIALKDTGRSAEALACFQRALALQPRYPDARNNLGNIFQKQGQLSEAIEQFRSALAVDPNHADAHCNMGLALMELGRTDEAMASYRQALRVAPNHADAHNNLGIAFKKLGRVDEAIQCYRQVLQNSPNHANAHNNLGYVLNDRGKTDEAILCYRQALRLDPHHAEAHNNLGIALIGHGELAEAADCFRQALRINPNLADAHSNLGNELAAEGRLAEAAECQRQALAISAGHKVALWNRSCLRLLQGDFAGGWPDYELRWEQPGMVRPAHRQPRWDGSPLAGKTILVYAEQGLGDTFQFVRYLPMVKARGGTVVFECPPALAGLFTRLAGIDQLVQAGQALPAFDVHIPLLSLPGVFGTRLDNIPAEVPYLDVDAGLVQDWGQRLGVAAPAPNGARLAGTEVVTVGIVWQGNPRFPGDRLRSIPLRFFEALGHVKDVRLISLQKEKVGVDQLRALRNRRSIMDLSESLETLSDTAAVLKNLDLLISSCTSVPHLAGALGVPVWLALQFAPDWRWLLERADTPWYPTMRLFRQRKLGDWEEVFTRIAEELALEVRTRRVGRADAVNPCTAARELPE